jgi:glycosyltransferase involved in cell wall biosynthesis
VVVQPAFVEDAPRPLLRAIAAGIPVVATPECGIEGLAGVRTVRSGDVEELRAAIADAMQG